MSEATWFKWLVVSTVLHCIALAVFSISVGKSTRKIDLSSAYSVNLIGDMGSGPKGPPGGAGLSEGAHAPAPVKEAPKPAKKEAPQKVKKPAPVRQPVRKPVPVRPEKDKDAVSLSKKKVPPKTPPPKETSKQLKKEKETPTKEELDALNKKLREIKRRSDYLDIGSRGSETAQGRGTGPGGSTGLPFSGDGAGRPIDLVTQRYWMDIGEKIRTAWGLPGSSFKKLQTEVTIKVRKDGKIVDINIDKRSGNRIFDESILRALKAVDPLPPIPASLNLDTIELPFRFRPEEMS